ncbi:hypothetical protein WOLCODRAFT_137037 [Wolfiporia cocos MD-104 SS10]|uniref:Uncharacterized protein n=1 Tax=Wolfiporia cocos (strain MD-104) TaxID=742152 RepID=A0A2H3JG16_WOLCO|nr:hypothetical protein WOLCODRAFT_137037 [Wolfiporia cocos MD-104 SS10]
MLKTQHRHRLDATTAPQAEVKHTEEPPSIQRPRRRHSPSLILGTFNAATQKGRVVVGWGWGEEVDYRFLLQVYPSSRTLRTI